MLVKVESNVKIWIGVSDIFVRIRVVIEMKFVMVEFVKNIV